MIQLLCQFFPLRWILWLLGHDLRLIVLDSKESGSFFRCKIKSHLTNLLGSAISCHLIITTPMKIVSRIYLDSGDAIWSTCAISDSLETVNWNFWYHEKIFAFRFKVGSLNSTLKSDWQTVLVEVRCENLVI